MNNKAAHDLHILIDVVKVIVSKLYANTGCEDDEYYNLREILRELKEKK